MLRVHQDMHAARTQGTNGGQKQLESDAILPAVIDQTVAQGRLVCLDEFQVTDVADALILQRLFTGLWQQGCVVVATSNRPPDELYLNGLQRDRFLPFIDVLKQKCQVVSMWDLDRDYRLIQKIESGTVPVYFSGRRGVEGTSRAAQAEFDKLFYDMVGKSRAVAPTTLQPSKQGTRRVRIPQASVAGGIARFTFEDLCQKALGAADYLTIGQHFHTVFVERMPILTLNEINWVRRFITFVDSMYESNVKLILHSRLPLSEIFERPEKKGDAQGNDDYQDDEVFAFDRTLSRLEEMSSQTYLQKRWAGAPDVAGDGPAALLSQHRAVVSVEPSLGDDPQKT